MEYKTILDVTAILKDIEIDIHLHINPITKEITLDIHSEDDNIGFTGIELPAVL